jgi:hypothetical protein
MAITVDLAPHVERALRTDAETQGATAEDLARRILENAYADPSREQNDADGTMEEFLAGYVGVVEGDSEPWSERTGDKFTDILMESHLRGRK